MINAMTDFRVQIDDITSATCDEALCGPGTSYLRVIFLFLYWRVFACLFVFVCAFSTTTTTTTRPPFNIHILLSFLSFFFSKLLEFGPCVGAIRRRMNIKSAIERPISQREYYYYCL
jgi:hypothetical protein